jgi:DNA-3-methyladenine glycosylase I
MYISGCTPERSEPLKKTCEWPADDPLMIEYHDTEWGVPVHDDTKLFEFLVLDAFQAGLSWRTVLHKRENFRKAFRAFDPVKVAKFGKRDVERLMKDAGIIRNRLKIESTIKNAKVLLEVQKEFGSFDRYIWGFTGGKTIRNRFRSIYDLPAESEESRAMSKDMKKRGFRFCGPTICYAFMQAAGMVNDHMVHCFRYREVGK